MNPQEAIGTALKREQDGYGFYREAVARASSDEARHMFEWLAGEERAHVDLWERVLKKFGEGDVWPGNDEVTSGGYLTEPLLSSQFPSKADVVGTLPADAPEGDIIVKAIEAERNDALFYEQMAEATADPDGKLVLQKAAFVERGHLALLEAQYQSLKSTNSLFALDRFSGTE